MRISGITLNNNKRIDVALTAVYGIGISKAKKILEELKIDFSIKTKDIKEEEENLIRGKIESEKTEGVLKREKAGDIKRLIDSGTYRGTRHSKRLPSRGQRTKTNSRTLKGAKKTMGSGKITVSKK